MWPILSGFLHIVWMPDVESLSRFPSLILLVCSLCWNSWNIYGGTVAFPYLYVQLLAGMLLCRAILIVVVLGSVKCDFRFFWQFSRPVLWIDKVGVGALYLQIMQGPCLFTLILINTNNVLQREDSRSGIRPKRFDISEYYFLVLMLLLWMIWNAFLLWFL